MEYLFHFYLCRGQGWLGIDKNYKLNRFSRFHSWGRKFTHPFRKTQPIHLKTGDTCHYGLRVEAHVPGTWATRPRLTALSQVCYYLPVLSFILHSNGKRLCTDRFATAMDEWLSPPAWVISTWLISFSFSWLMVQFHDHNEQQSTYSKTDYASLLCDEV